MPPMAERMASVETSVIQVREDVGEIKTDVKTLIAWMHEERGARKQRALSSRQLFGLVSVVSGAVGLIARFLPLPIPGGN